jgi:hypothetical protein
MPERGTNFKLFPRLDLWPPRPVHSRSKLILMATRFRARRRDPARVISHFKSQMSWVLIIRKTGATPRIPSCRRGPRSL